MVFTNAINRHVGLTGNHCKRKNEKKNSFAAWKISSSPGFFKHFLLAATKHNDSHPRYHHHRIHWKTSRARFVQPKETLSTHNQNPTSLFHIWKENTTKKDKRDRKSTRLNSSHANISYAVFCLKKKKKIKSNNYILLAWYSDNYHTHNTYRTTNHKHN